MSMSKFSGLNSKFGNGVKVRSLCHSLDIEIGKEVISSSSRGTDDDETYICFRRKSGKIELFGTASNE